MLYQGYANGKGDTTKYELVPQTGHAGNSSHHLQCQAGIFERIRSCTISGLSTQRRRIVKETIKVLNTGTGVYYVSQEDLPTINQVFDEVAKRYDKMR